MSQLFGEKKFGFGFMRLPLLPDGTVDEPQVCRMIDRFLAGGFRYFDTAHGYLDGKSEQALNTCLVQRYPREAYILTDKLSPDFFQTEEEIRPLLDVQLKAVGVSYFDNYLMHAMNKNYYEKYQACHAFEVAKSLKEEGKIRHIGISFHDKPEVLEQILTEHPEIEMVQIQFNYADFDDPRVQSRAVYEVCRRHHKPIIVMEPVKGGRLVNLPQEAQAVFAAHGGSPASFAVRFAASFERIEMVLSGVSTEAQMEENASVMEQLRPLSETEHGAIARVQEILKEQKLIECTACRYCVPGCPMKIKIPSLFENYNQMERFQGWDSSAYYRNNTANGFGKASDCIGCGQCEEACPQHLPIRELLKKVAARFE